MSSNQKVIVVTGGNSGVGFECCKELAKHDNVHLILASRNKERVHEAAEQVRATAAASAQVEEGVVDLGSLKSVQDFSQRLRSRGLQLSTLVCNGGVQYYTSKQTTEDGFEKTFGVNHLGHFLLVMLLRDCTERVVTIGSETHDPAEHTGVPVPNVSDLSALARGYTPFNPLEAYSTSKLCNMNFAFELAQRFPGQLQAMTYSPGLTPDAGLYRNMDPAMLEGIKQRSQHEHPDMLSTCKLSGAVLARVAFEDWSGEPWKNGMYVSIANPREPSAQAKDHVLAMALWDKCLELVQSYL
jgi:NAD(P)-dependent dehydrogenase (short-subunit alcohol dehydrogenase family)